MLKSKKRSVKKEPEVNRYGEYIKIGGSPVRGLTLRQILRGHTDAINRIAWSPDGQYLASPSNDQTVRIWDPIIGHCVSIIEGSSGEVISVEWSPDTQHIALVHEDVSIQIWDVLNQKREAIIGEHQKSISSLIWSLDENTLVSGSYDGTIRFWDLLNEMEYKNCTVPAGGIARIALSPDKRIIASGGNYENPSIFLWEVESGQKIWEFQGHKQYVSDLIWTSDGQKLYSASGDKTIRIWDILKKCQILSVERHTDYVTSMIITFDGLFLASKGADNTVKILRTSELSMVAEISESCRFSLKTNSGIAFHPHLPILATLGEYDTIIRIWELDEEVLLGKARESVNYTTAKLVLVGDSGVGKTGLGWRLAHGEFKEHASTHGQQFWPVSQLNLKRKDGTDCEAVLWDLAGQHVYRQVHSIFLDNVSAAMVLFDPTNRQEPLKGAQFWLEQLKGKSTLPPTVLVGARVDRGAPALPQAELDQFCQRYGIKGGYISTSAMNGDGLDALLDILKAQIPWDEMTATVTTVTFKRIKDYVLSLKEKTDRKGVLVTPDALRVQLQATDIEWSFTDAEMMTAVGHLETHGYVSILSNSAGEQFILLTPELLASLAASIMLQADKNSRELGAISETELLGGKVPFDDLKGLDKEERQILIDAAIVRFLEHNICFRETLNDDTLLIFPSLIKQKRPLQDDLPATDDISYVVRGRVENLYASLVVLLGYTPSFMRINQWQNQAQYEMREGEMCGFRMIEEREGEIEFVLYYGDAMQPSGRDKFQELFEQFLYQRDVEVTRFPPAVCPKRHPIERNTFMSRMREGQKFVFCYKCDDKVPLPEMKPMPTIGISASPWLQIEEAMARLRSLYEQYLTNIKSYRRGWAIPRAYISRLPEQEQWAGKLIHDLKDAGVYIVEKTKDLEAEDFVIVLDTLVYQRAFQASSTTLAMQVVRSRLGSKKMLSLACEGTMSKHEFEACNPGNFCDETHYAVSLFNLVMELYAIPLDHKGFEPLRQSLHHQWEQTLAGKKIVEEPKSKALKLFISYSHKDEEFKEELVSMLAGLQRQGIIDPWQDRCIDEGEEWYQQIQRSMNECDLAILLVSRHFIASHFINDEELPRLLHRRKESGLRVVPVIVRPCKWTSEPVLKDLQALPKDGKPVISFDQGNGDREQVWVDIATIIEKRTKEKR